MNDAATTDGGAGARAFGRAVSFWLLVVVLLWAPFPLGGAIAWAPGIQEIGIAACWTFWFASTCGAQGGGWKGNRVIVVPFGLAMLALGWAIIQSSSHVPSSWAHPVWTLSGEILHTQLPAAISLNPWRTESEFAKLGSYVLVAVLTFEMARSGETARHLLTAILVIGALYAIYGIGLTLSGYRQTDIFYATPHLSENFSGTFVSRNNFADFMGLITIAATAKLFGRGSEVIVNGHGWRRLVISVTNYCLGRGGALLVLMVLSLGAVVASASRAGVASTFCGLLALAIAAFFVTPGGSSRHRTGACTLAASLPLIGLILWNGGTLSNRLLQLFDTGIADSVRLDLWDAARRMISDSPWLGLGLGTFQDAYPLYSPKVYAYVMDKAHCDYLEFAAGLGLPAAIVWWGAMLWVFASCVRGLRVRRRNRIYCLVAIAASVLIAVHCCVDFALQLPSVALFYAVLMGIGVAQSIPTHARARAEQC